MRYDGGARNLFHEAGSQGTLESATGVIGAERKQEGGVGFVTTQYFDETRHTLQRAAPGVDIDFQGELQGSVFSVNQTAGGSHVATVGFEDTF